jgi:glycerol-3-phosphate cytidylyltransferase
MRKVMTYGTFDLFHIGHLELLRRAKELGDYLIVGVSNDEFNDLKGKKCIHPYKERSEIVSAIKYVDRVIPEYSWKQKRSDMLEFKIDIFTIGDDWKGKFDDLKDICDVKYLSRTEGISTTEIKNII